MNMRISQLNGANTAGYFDRLPEKLVLEGYRRWTAGFETGSIIPWGNDTGPLFGSAWAFGSKTRGGRAVAFHPRAAPLR